MTAEGLKDDPETAFVEKLLHGNEPDDGPLLGESKEADTRATWLRCGAWALAAAIAVTVVILMVLLSEGT